MDALGWIIAIVLLLVFGKHLQLTANIPLDNTNAVPTGADNVPVLSIQNNANSPANQPAPWSNQCTATPEVNPVNVSVLPLNYAMPISQPMPQKGTIQRVTFSQPRY